MVDDRNQKIARGMLTQKKLSTVYLIHSFNLWPVSAYRRWSCYCCCYYHYNYLS